MIKNKVLKLVSAVKDIREAGQQKRKARYKISSLLSVNDKRKSCIEGFVVGMGDSSVFEKCCPSFRCNQVCEDNRCSMIAKNMKYAAAREIYNSAWKNLFKELAIWKNEKTN